MSHVTYAIEHPRFAVLSHRKPRAWRDWFRWPFPGKGSHADKPVSEGRHAAYLYRFRLAARYL